MPSLAQIQWWFRSRQSGKLNSVTYWVLGCLCSIPLYVGIDFTLHMVANIRNSSDEADWITTRHPKALASAATGGGARFPEQQLIDDIQYGKDPGKEARLFSALSLLRGDSNCGKTAETFGKAEIRVYPACVTYTAARSKADASLSTAEALVFRRFAASVIRAFKNPPTNKADDNHTERRLARSLGLWDTTNAPLLDVPWIYVASEQGAIAVFPGTDVIAEHYDPASRPWFMATFLAKSQLSSDVPEAHDRLSVTYLDVLAESSILVRTYLHKFTSNGEEFVVGIDLHRRGESLSRDILGDSPWATIPWTVRLATALALSLVLLAILRWISSATTRCFCFDRLANSIYGIVEAKDKGQAVQKSEQADKITVGVAGGDRVRGSAERSWMYEEGFEKESTAEASRPLRRGQELWSVGYNTRVSWHFFGLRFESISSARLGRIQLVYTSAILPEAGWEPFIPGPFSDTEARAYERKLPEILRRNADGAEDGRLEVPEDADALMPLGLPKVPAWVARAVPNPQELSALSQRRAYVSVSTTTLQYMYSNADLVRAVVLQSYFERILEQGQTEFLLRGRIVHRLISFPDGQARLHLSKKSRAVYQEFLEAFGTPSRVLRRVDSPMTIEGTLVPVYDFAIIKDCDGERVFVAHAISEISVIDIASPKRASQAYRVDGYLSWRTADVRFYADLFDRLASKSKEITLDDEIGAQVEVDTEPEATSEFGAATWRR